MKQDARSATDTFAARKARAIKMAKDLKRLFPGAGVFLEYGDPWQLLVAVVLSAQCTDAQVNKVTRTLFKKYPTLEYYLHADPREFARDIYSTGFYRTKSRNILAAARIVHEQHRGRVPRTMEELCALPGVGRKTANIVLANAYGVVVGIPVDTHVRRLARRYGLTSENEPNKIEQDLMALLPQKEWFGFSYRLIQYGRAYCPARRHDHAACPL
jgi:endonuclease III